MSVAQPEISFNNHATMTQKNAMGVA